MQSFPAVDPIPLPAPIWLIKLLHIVTLALHFVAVEMLLGGLLIAVVLSLFRNSPHASVTARALATPADRGDDLRDQPRRASAVVCAGALRARALHSSVLIGAVLDLDHCGAYRPTGCSTVQRRGSRRAKSAWWVGLSAWVLAGYIARMLSTNMTLMLRPEVWREMYSASALGAYLPTGDPTLTPRWLLMMAGGIVHRRTVAGVPRGPQYVHSG